MPFITEIRCPTNGLLFASFQMWNAFYYRLGNGIEFPLDVGYAWCHRCERFVECERLYSIDEIKTRIDDLLATKSDWHEDDARAAERFADSGHDLPCNLKQAALYKSWVAALAWRRNRRTPPRCLECGSFSAIKILPESEEVPHPAGNCPIVVGSGGHASVAGLRDLVFFNAEGLKID